MSTWYRPLRAILLEELLDGRLAQFEVREFHVPDKTTEQNRCLTDGRNYVWVYGTESGSVEFTRYGGNAPGRILQAVQEAFDVVIVSEYEPQFWGFDTKEQWDASEKERARQQREYYYLELVKFVRGEPNDIRPGTIGENEAMIAKQLVTDRPELLLPEMKDEFFRAIEGYRRNLAITVTLTQEEMAVVQMIAHHEDDLPSA
jgi:hypothetical protein